MIIEDKEFHYRELIIGNTNLPTLDREISDLIKEGYVEIHTFCRYDDLNNKIYCVKMELNLCK